MLLVRTLLLLLSAQASALTVTPVELTALQRALAGAAAYCSATAVSSPVDVVKTRLQTTKGGASALTTAAKMLRTEGVFVFYAGIAPALMMAPAAMVQYALIDPLRQVMPIALAAVIAGGLDITIKCPFERLKTQMQGSTNGESFWHILAANYRERGIAGLWAGYGATLVRDLPYLVIKWQVYTLMQALLGEVNTMNLISGAVAGAVAATFVTPADVVKTRLQVTGAKTPMLLAARDLLREGGPVALFRGLAPRLARIPVYTAVTLATFDWVKSLFALHNAGLA